MKRLTMLLLLTLWSVPQMWAASANLTTNGSACPASTNTTAIVVNLPQDDGGATLTVSGTWTGTISFYGTGSGGGGGPLWTALNATPLGSSTAVTSTTSNGTWQVNVAGFTGVCMLSSASMTGTANVTVNPSAASARSNGGGGGGGSGTVNSGTGGNPACYKTTGTAVSGCTGETFSSGGVLQSVNPTPTAAVALTATGDAGSDDVVQFNVNGSPGGSVFRIDSLGNLYFTDFGVPVSTLLDIDPNSEINIAGVAPPLLFADDNLSCPSCPSIAHEVNQSGPITANTNTTNPQQLQTLLPDQLWSNLLGVVYTFPISGIYSVTGTPTVTLTLKLCTVQDCSSGTVVNLASFTTAAVTTASNNQFIANVQCVTYNGGTSATYYCHGILSIDLISASHVATVYTDAITGASSPIDATAQLYPGYFVSFSAGSTSNSMTSQLAAMLPQ